MGAEAGNGVSSVSAEAPTAMEDVEAWIGSCLFVKAPAAGGASPAGIPADGPCKAPPVSDIDGKAAAPAGAPCKMEDVEAWVGCH